MGRKVAATGRFGTYAVVDGRTDGRTGGRAEFMANRRGLTHSKCC